MGPMNDGIINGSEGQKLSGAINDPHAGELRATGRRNPENTLESTLEEITKSPSIEALRFVRNKLTSLKRAERRDGELSTEQKEDRKSLQTAAVSITEALRNSGMSIEDIARDSGIAKDRILRWDKAAVRLATEVISIRALSKSDPERAKNLADQSFDLFERSFPDPDERIGRGSFDKYCFPNDQRPEADHLVTIDLKTGKVIAGSLVNVFDTPEGRFGIETYLYVDPAHRGRGVGSNLYAKALGHAKSKGALLLFGEMNDPFAMTPEQKTIDSKSGTTPEARRAYWSNRGRLAVDAPYAQPALEDESKPVEYLLISVAPLKEGIKSMTGKQYKAMLKAFFGVFVESLDTDPTWIKIKSLVHDNDTLNFIPLGQKRSWIDKENSGSAWGKK